MWCDGLVAEWFSNQRRTCPTSIESMHFNLMERIHFLCSGIQLEHVSSCDFSRLDYFSIHGHQPGYTLLCMLSPRAKPDKALGELLASSWHRQLDTTCFCRYTLYVLAELLFDPVCMSVIVSLSTQDRHGNNAFSATASVKATSEQAASDYHHV